MSHQVKVWPQLFPVCSTAASRVAYGGCTAHIEHNAWVCCAATFPMLAAPVAPHPPLHSNGAAAAGVGAVIVLCHGCGCGYGCGQTWHLMRCRSQSSSTASSACKRTVTSNIHRSRNYKCRTKVQAKQQVTAHNITGPVLLTEPAT